MPVNKPFVVFEGTAGAGKTTLINALINERKDLHVLYRPKLIFEDRGNELPVKVEQEDGRNISVSEHIRRGHFFLRGMIEAQKEMDRERLCIADRWYYSTIFYQMEIIEKIGGKAPQGMQSIIEELVSPDFVFILTTAPKTASERKGIEFDEERYNQIRKKYLHKLPTLLQAKGIPYLELDSTDASLEGLFDTIKESLDNVS